MSMTKHFLAASGVAALFCVAPLASAAPIAYFSKVGKGGVGNPQTLNSTNNTGQSMAFELIFDYTSAIEAATNPILLWEMGATGSGAALVLAGAQMHFFAGDNETDVVSGNHELTALADDVQVVSVFEITGGNETLSIYVNGEEIATGDFATANIWAGSDAGGVGVVQGGAGTRYNAGSGKPATTLFNPGDVDPFPNNTDITLNMYHLASSGGPVDNTLDNILVPSPTAMLMGAVGLGMCALRRRRR